MVGPIFGGGAKARMQRIRFSWLKFLPSKSKSPSLTPRQYLIPLLNKTDKFVVRCTYPSATENEAELDFEIVADGPAESLRVPLPKLGQFLFNAAFQRCAEMNEANVAGELVASREEGAGFYFEFNDEVTELDRTSCDTPSAFLFQITRRRSEEPSRDPNLLQGHPSIKLKSKSGGRSGLSQLFALGGNGCSAKCLGD